MFHSCTWGSEQNQARCILRTPSKYSNLQTQSYVKPSAILQKVDNVKSVTLHIIIIYLLNNISISITQLKVLYSQKMYSFYQKANSANNNNTYVTLQLLLNGISYSVYFVRQTGKYS